MKIDVIIEGPLSFQKKKKWWIVLFDGTVFEHVFFKTENYNVYVDLTQ